MSRSVPMRAALVACLATFAGSIAGFNLTTDAGGTPGREALAVDRSAPSELVALKRDCPEKVRRLWEEA